MRHLLSGIAAKGPIGRRLQGYVRRRVVGANGRDWERQYLDGRTTPPRDDVIRLSQYSELEELTFTFPGDTSPTTMRFLPRYTYLLEDVVLDPFTGLVYDKTSGIIPESSAWSLFQQQLSWPKPRMRSRYLAELSPPQSAVFLPGGKFSGYYHWLLEDLPAALASVAIAKNPVVLVPRLRCGYVDDILDLLDLPVIELSRPHRFRRLVMTGKTAGMGSPYGVASPHPADVRQLRAYFQQFLKPLDPSNKLVVTRAGQRRSAANEGELIAALTSNGYRTIDPAALSLTAQIETVSSAAMFVGLHGAAHANCVWMSPGSGVEELLSHSYVTGYFAALSACVGVDYRAHVYAGKNWEITADSMEAAVRSALGAR
jgi:hypothetical protein